MSAGGGKRIAIIGGGLAGLACAQRLASLDSNDVIASVSVFDTGNRNSGGRCSSRVDKKTGYEFDHAAQYFSIDREKSEKMFAEYCREAVERAELYAVDSGRYGVVSREAGFKAFEEDGLLRYASTDGFRAFVKRLEDSVLDVANGQKNAIERPQWVGSMQKQPGTKKWVLANTPDQRRSNYRELGEFDFVVVAHNGKCAYNLMKTAVVSDNGDGNKTNESPKILNALKASFGIKPREALYKKRELVLSSVWSANVAIGNLDEDTIQKLDSFDGTHVIGNDCLAYIGNNTLKKKKKEKMAGIREITLLSTPLYGKRNKCPQEAIPAAVADKVQLDLVTELEKMLEITSSALSSNITFAKMQLWGAANGLTVANSEYLLDANASVGVCGDWLTSDDQSPSVETAMRSGWRLAEAILKDSTENHLRVNWKPVQNASALGLSVPGANLPDPPPEEAPPTRRNNNNAGGSRNNASRQKQRRARKPASPTAPRAMSTLSRAAFN